MPISEYSKLSKQISDNSKQLSILEKDNKELKKIIKNLERKINLVLDKIQDFEVVFDAAELIEDQIEKQDKNTYNTEWNPYDDEDFEPEDYENFDDDDDVVTGY
jgi:cell division protein FtsB